MSQVVLYILIYALGSIADVLTTLRALSRGGREDNGFLRYVMNRLGHWWITIKLGISAVVAYTAVTTGFYPMLLFLGIILLFISYRNTKV